MSPLPADQYYQNEYKKFQIYIHHTAGSTDPKNAMQWWNSTPERVGTSLIIGGWAKETDSWKDGDIIQTFSTKYWAHHLGLTKSQLKPGGEQSKSNTWLNSRSVAIELSNWGGLTKSSDGKFWTYSKKEIPSEQVVSFDTPYRGYYHFQKYTTAQLDNLSELLQFLTNKYTIPIKYKGDRIFDICPDALQGSTGIYTHTSVRPDKSDCSPQPELIKMLKSL